MHIPVLLGEVIEALKLKEGDVVVDATFGSGGHSLEIARKIGKRGRLIAIDWDMEEIKRKNPSVLEEILKFVGKVDYVEDNFGNLESILEKLGIDRVDSILADLGWRIEQIEDPSYGLSFLHEGPLSMRLAKKSSESEETASDIINFYPEEKLEEIFRLYGEERHAKKAAMAIVRKRKEHAITSTKELSQIIQDNIGKYYRKFKIHPATRVFQGLRIAVNKELENLKSFLPIAVERLKKSGRLAVITFHSLEDRIVKESFRAYAGGCVCPEEALYCTCGRKKFVRIINKKPIKAKENEVDSNPRSRSAKLRVVEKTHSNHNQQGGL